MYTELREEDVAVLVVAKEKAAEIARLQAEIDVLVRPMYDRIVHNGDASEVKYFVAMLPEGEWKRRGLEVLGRCWDISWYDLPDVRSILSGSKK